MHKDIITSTFGIITSMLTLILVIAINHYLNFNLFTLSFWVIIPAGAIICGLAATSGYYFGSIITNAKPTKRLLVFMIILAGATQFSIYYSEYYTLKLSNGKYVRNMVEFDSYLKITLTNAKYGLMKRDRHLGDGVKVGSMGYLLATSQFVGFMVGGICMYIFLVSKAFCEKCNRYFKSRGSKILFFSNSEMYLVFLTDFSKKIVTPEFLGDFLDKSGSNSDELDKGYVRNEIKLLKCDDCMQEIIKNSVEVFNCRDWKDVDKLNFEKTLPQGQSLLNIFKKAA